MAANRRKQDDKNLEILRELISVNGNKYCLDCNQRGPTYVNTTIGSFVCSKCSGMLRGLTPPHRVKSISMATFTPEELEYIKARGNDYCRRVWLGLYEGESVNFTDEQSVKDFMSDKYEKKRYYLDSPLGNLVVNGNSSMKNKAKIKLNNAASSTPLISISAALPQTSKATVNNNTMSQAKVVNNTHPALNDSSHRVARPVNNFSQPLLNNISMPTSTSITASVPDFPVDFSTANIYNSSQYNNNSNNFTMQSAASTPMFNAFNTPTSTSNDRYAALADLDMALRQQNLKIMEEGGNISNKNPFQSSTTNDLFANSKNPFNGGWSTVSAHSVPVNPFMPSPNNTGIINSKNPFL
ncbi:arf-GAP domain and FG repeat-containing protein 1 isoform X1 [Plodia interpunctella]|uniref:arf-GAP domain and FG repeat-containing protein 1 isoform X1 n=1 Tax=Plodia interpunctella TaxID=58824 RepID=UPI00236774C9|nr:arf-GAP domain and FG repeat-containing protein 1 isoform X1 [Plodia interpunctella]